jgi:hypothetical protein
MSGVGVIHGVDDTLKLIARNAVASMSTKPEITVGPLKSSGSLRLNWFLYRVEPHPGYRNMEPPATGWRTSRGRPPLALQLHYLLTAFPGGAAADGDQEQFSHAALASVMQALHENAILGDDDPALSPHATPLLEPLRISLEPLDLEALSKLWTAAGEAMRLSVGYLVTLVAIDATETHVAGPPVLTARVVVVPAMGPRLLEASPARVSASVDVRVDVGGLTSGTAFSVARDARDPAGSGDWAITSLKQDGPRTVVLRLPSAALAPGMRRLDVTAAEEGVTVGGDSLALTVVPTIVGPAAEVAGGATVELDTQHAAADVEVFARGVALPASAVTYTSPTKVTIEVPTGAAEGVLGLALRAGKVAGPVYTGLTVGP